MSNVGKRGKVSLRVRLRDALLKGTNSTIRHNEIREVIDALSKPPAREDAQPVGYWVEHKSAENPVLIRHGSFVPASDHYKTTTLYTHPAPDALRVAVAKLEKAKITDDPAEVFMLAMEALAALQAEQKGGA